MKELFKEMAECKNEIRNLKSIVRQHHLISLQSNDQFCFFFKVLSENHFLKRRSISTGKPDDHDFFFP